MKISDEKLAVTGYRPTDSIYYIFYPHESQTQYKLTMQKIYIQGAMGKLSSKFHKKRKHWHLTLSDIFTKIKWKYFEIL